MSFSKLIRFSFLFLISSGIKLYAQPVVISDSIYNIQDSVIIQTRDGASIIATVVIKKANTQPLPAILFYTTYYQGKGDIGIAEKIADRDYAGVIAYSRGIRKDLNEYEPYVHDGKDAYDVIEWISKQIWSNGKVGMYGGSYTGFVQWAVAKELHPALKTIVPQVAVMPGFDSPMENNVPFPNILGWPNNNIYNYKPLPQDLNDNWYMKGSSFRSLDSLAGQPDPIFQKWLLHPDYDEYWSSLVPAPEDYAKINIPVLTTTGYYDACEISALQYFKLHNKYNPNADHYLVTGPYDHRGGQKNAASNLMGYEIDPAANISIQDLIFEWLDYILKDGKKPEILKEKINYEVMGSNEWKHVRTLEEMNNDTLVLFLSSIPDRNNFSLSENISAEKNFLKQTVDFKDRSTQNNYFTPFIINDSLDASNGLVFKTEPFKEAFSINGSFTGELNAMINKKDMDVSIAFYEQMPDGKYFYLTRYLGRASYAKDNSKRQLLTPGKEENIPFDNTRLVSKLFSKGSRLVIVLNVNKHPYEVINYGSGKDVNDETINDAGKPLEVKWYNDSFISIPVWK